MKKLVLTAAMVACAAVVTAQTVTSANIVGYSKASVDAGEFLIVAPQFLQDSAGGMTLGEAFDGLQDLSKVHVWQTGGGYLTYTYFGGDWYLGSTISNDVLIPSGTGVWLEGAGATASPVTAGEVTDVATIGVDYDAGFDLIANPYPTTVALGDITVSDLDKVHVWQIGGGYLTYTYFGGDWYLGSTISNTVEIPVGVGFWLESAAAGTLTFAKPY